MSASGWLNGGAALFAVALAAASGAQHRHADGDDTVIAADATALTDAGGHVTRIRPFRRIVSGSTIVDRLLIELCEPDRIVAFTAYGAERSPLAYQYSGKALMRSSDDVEQLLALKPDLFLTNSFGSPAKLARLREAGIEVFDLGEARGLSSLLEDARTVATLLGRRARGEKFARTFERRFAHVAATIAPGERRRAIYLSVYGNQLFGGGAGSSYHDLLIGAGLADAAAERFGSWPRYSPEQLLELDPDVIVTKRGMRAAICERTSLAHLAACTRGLIVEVSGDQLDDPGPAMLESAEQIFSAVYASRK